MYRHLVWAALGLLFLSVAAPLAYSGLAGRAATAPLPAAGNPAAAQSGRAGVPVDAALVAHASVPPDNVVALATYHDDTVLQVTSFVAEAALRPAVVVGLVLPADALPTGRPYVTAHLAARALPGNGSQHFAVALQSGAEITPWARLDSSRDFTDHVVVWPVARPGPDAPPPRLLVAADLAGEGRGIELRRIVFSQSDSVSRNQAPTTGDGPSK